jgi:hypothetical protein
VLGMHPTMIAMLASITLKELSIAIQSGGFSRITYVHTIADVRSVEVPLKEPHL